MSIFHQHSHPISKYCSSVTPPPGLKPDYLRWGKGASPVRYKIKISTRKLLKRFELTFRIIQL